MLKYLKQTPILELIQTLSLHDDTRNLKSFSHEILIISYAMSHEHVSLHLLSQFSHIKSIKIDNI